MEGRLTTTTTFVGQLKVSVRGACARASPSGVRDAPVRSRDPRRNRPRKRRCAGGRTLGADRRSNRKCNTFEGGLFAESRPIAPSSWSRAAAGAAQRTADGPRLCAPRPRRALRALPQPRRGFGRGSGASPAGEPLDADRRSDRNCNTFEGVLFAESRPIRPKVAEPRGRMRRPNGPPPARVSSHRGRAGRRAGASLNHGSCQNWPAEKALRGRTNARSGSTI
jgi:hypothetical protein